jgi:hypothetical protein
MLQIEHLTLAVNWSSVEEEQLDNLARKVWAQYSAVRRRLKRWVPSTLVAFDISAPSLKDYVNSRPMIVMSQTDIMRRHIMHEYLDPYLDNLCAMLTQLIGDSGTTLVWSRSNSGGFGPLSQKLRPCLIAETVAHVAKHGTPHPIEDLQIPTKGTYVCVQRLEQQHNFGCASDVTWEVYDLSEECVRRAQIQWVQRHERLTDNDALCVAES